MRCPCSNVPTTLGTRLFLQRHKLKRPSKGRVYRCAQNCADDDTAKTECDVVCDKCGLACHFVCCNKISTICIPPVVVDPEKLPYRLEELCASEDFPVPSVLLRLVLELENCRTARTPRLYALPIPDADFQCVSARLLVDVNADVSCFDGKHLVLGLKHVLLFALKDPLLSEKSCDFIEDHIKTLNPATTGTRLGEYVTTIQPLGNRVTLALVMHHLHFVLAHSRPEVVANDKMTVEELAKLFCSCIVGLRKDTDDEWTRAVNITLMLLALRPSVWDSILTQADPSAFWPREREQLASSN